jgi:hypothetical protein
VAWPTLCQCLNHPAFVLLQAISSEAEIWITCLVFVVLIPATCASWVGNAFNSTALMCVFTTGVGRYRSNTFRLSSMSEESARAARCWSGYSSFLSWCTACSLKFRPACSETLPQRPKAALGSAHLSPSICARNAWASPCSFPFRLWC